VVVTARLDSHLFVTLTPRTRSDTFISLGSDEWLKMNVSTLRNWGGAVAVSLPKKLLAMLGLGAGAAVQVKVKDGAIVLSPVRARRTLAQLEKEQRRLEKSLGRTLAERDWVESPARGRELL
jgi:antitoxin ChpS